MPANTFDAIDQVWKYVCLTEDTTRIRLQQGIGAFPLLGRKRLGDHNRWVAGRRRPGVVRRSYCMRGTGPFDEMLRRTPLGPF